MGWQGEGGGVKKVEIWGDVIYGWSLSKKIFNSSFLYFFYEGLKYDPISIKYVSQDLFYKFWNKIELETYLEQKSTACLTEYQGKESFSHKIMRNRCSDREIVANLNFDLIPFNLGYIQVPWNWNLKYEK